MNKFSTLILFLVLNGALIGTAFAAVETCLKTGDAITTVSGNSTTPVGSIETGGDATSDQCSDTPDAYKLGFYMMALCKSDPSLLDYSSCQYLLEPITNINSAVEHTINFPASGSLNIPPFDIPPGVYTHMVAIISNEIGIKNTITTTNTTTGASSSTGKTCWTSNAGPSGIANDEADTPHGSTVAGGTQLITCGSASDAAPIFSNEIINVLTDSNDCSATYAANGDRDADMGTVGNGTGVVSLLSANDTFATDCEDAQRLLWTITLSSPVTITPQSIYSLQMKTQNSVSVDFSSSSNTNILKMGADPIQTFFVVTEPK